MKLFEGEAYIEKSSKFYGYFFDVNSVQEFKQILDDLKKKHKGAGHFCYGYRIEESTCGEQESMFDEKVLSEKKSDDGEPSGCGKILLNLLRHYKHKNAALIVVRYWGGILLGAGPLVRAYKTAGANALKCVSE